MDQKSYLRNRALRLSSPNPHGALWNQLYLIRLENAEDSTSSRAESPVHVMNSVDMNLKFKRSESDFFIENNHVHCGGKGGKGNSKA